MASKIEWTGSTWNPIVGCSVVSPGCTNCYAMRMAARLGRMRQERYAGLTKPTKAGPVWTGEVRLVESALTLPLRTRKPTTWFVNSMSDLFHEDVPDACIDRIFAVMALCPQHTFQVLTKRSARMRAYCSGSATLGRVARVLVDEVLIEKHWPFADATWPVKSVGDIDDPADIEIAWPLPSVWLGVSAEDQRRADERVPDLLATPAAVRFVSAEPLLGPIDFTAIRPTSGPAIDALDGFPNGRAASHLDWIIAGKESGPGARRIDDGPVRVIRDQCERAGVAFFYKQDAKNGRKIPTPELDGRTHLAMPDVAR